MRSTAAGVVAVALVSLAGACSGSSAPDPGSLTRIAPPDRVEDPGTTINDSVLPNTIVLDSTSTAPVWTPSTPPPPAVPATASPAVCPADPPATATSTTALTVPVGGVQPAIEQSRAALDAALDDPRFQQAELAVSIWVDGLGEVAARNPYRAFPPASTQKLLTAAGAYERLDIDERVRTTVVAAGPVVDGVVEGDLVLVGGGDPTLTRRGARSLDALVTQLRAKGIVRVGGNVLVDESRYDGERSVPSWPVGWESTIGPMSALVVDRNRNADLADPALTHGESFRQSLNAAGIAVDGSVEYGTVGEGMQVALVDGPTYGELVTTMLQNSDALVAELLVKEIGRRHTGTGTTVDGLASIKDAVAVLCVPPGGNDVDGSGFSPADSHSADQLRRLLQLAARRTWGARFKASLPVAGQSGTLAGRLVGPQTTGNIRAKTGSIAVAKALSGYATTASGRQAYFSIIVNGRLTGGLEPAVDSIAAAVAGLRG